MSHRSSKYGSAVVVSSRADDQYSTSASSWDSHSTYSASGRSSYSSPDTSSQTYEDRRYRDHLSGGGSLDVKPRRGSKRDVVVFNHNTRREASPSEPKSSGYPRSTYNTSYDTSR